MVSVRTHVWEVVLDGKWGQFGYALVQDAVDAAYQSGCDGYKFKTGHWEYDIDFARMVQINNTTKRERPLRRVLKPPDTTPLTSPTPLPKTAPTPKPLPPKPKKPSGEDKWSALDDADAQDAVDKAFRSGCDRYTFEARGRKYEVDFSKLVQGNGNTERVRGLRRVTKSDDAVALPTLLKTRKPTASKVPPKKQAKLR